MAARTSPPPHKHPTFLHSPPCTHALRPPVSPQLHTPTPHTLLRRAALLLQVFSPIQKARVVAACYPHFPDVVQLVRSLAERAAAAGAQQDEGQAQPGTTQPELQGGQPQQEMIAAEGGMEMGMETEQAGLSPS